VDFVAWVMDQLIGSQSTPLLMVLRSFVLCAWQKSVFKSFAQYMQSKFGCQWYTIPSGDLDAGRDCVFRATAADFGSGVVVHAYSFGDGRLRVVYGLATVTLFILMNLFLPIGSANLRSQTLRYVLRWPASWLSLWIEVI
jgi:hypothetical protein